MRIFATTLLRTLLLLLLACSAAGCQSPKPAGVRVVPEGQRILFREAITRRIDTSQQDTDAYGGTIIVGSSIFRLWDSVEEDLSPWQPVNHGFGGARTWELLEYADDLVIAFRPEIVVCYCGSNDINAGQNAQGIAERTLLFMDRLEQALPNVEIVYVAINLAPQKRDRWDVVNRANAMVKEICAQRGSRHFLDVNRELFDRNGNPRLELYRDDELHFQPRAYTEIFAPGVAGVLETIRPSNEQ